MLKYLVFLALIAPHIAAADRVENNEAAQEMLSAARTVWQDSKLADYTFTLERGGVFGGVKYRVKVKDGKCLKVTYWHRLKRHKDTCDNRTIAELLDELDQVIEEDPISIWLEFDPELGYPIEVLVEPKTDLTDQDWWYVISRFHH